MDTINISLNKLIHYGLRKNIITENDVDYCANRLIHLLKQEEFIKVEINQEDELTDILEAILEFATTQKIIVPDSITFSDIFDTEIMNCLMPRPSEVTRTFWNHYHKNYRAATDYFYQLSIDSNYIRKNRIEKNMAWKTTTDYGDMDITINLSKPEKDPLAIALSKSTPKNNYPKCLLCKENVGYYGNVLHPARSNHRIIKLLLNEEEWFLQYSPYVYYNEHCIILKDKHEPMLISRETFKRLLDFVSIFPHYFIGSNADLPIVGGSILDHDHYQGGNYEFAMAKANVIKTFDILDVEIGIVDWPLSVLRLKDKNKDKLIQLADCILKKWRDYSDESVDIYAHTFEQPHNTVTPIARFKDNKFELDLILRNNRTTKENPLGIFHPHEEHHHLKKENIGLIEVMGLAVLPARLVSEIKIVKNSILNRFDLDMIDEAKKHKIWVNDIKSRYVDINTNNIDEIIKKEISLKFSRILEQCGVFKRNNIGLNAFMRFIQSILQSNKS